MNKMHKMFGRRCENCAICNRARENRDGLLYKLMDSPIHGAWCPAWQGYKKLEAEGMLKKKQTGGPEA